MALISVKDLIIYSTDEDQGIIIQYERMPTPYQILRVARKVTGLALKSDSITARGIGQSHVGRSIILLTRKSRPGEGTTQTQTRLLVMRGGVDLDQLSTQESDEARNFVVLANNFAGTEGTRQGRFVSLTEDAMLEAIKDWDSAEPMPDNVIKFIRGTYGRGSKSDL